MTNKINALFELVGACLAWRAVCTGHVADVFLFSAFWAGWCIPYYLSHKDRWSAWFAVARAAGVLALAVLR